MGSRQRRIRADQIFAQALDLTGEARARHVAEACGDDGDLRRLVEELLTGASGDDTLLAPGGGGLDDLLDGFADHLDAAERSPAGTEIGRYRLLEEIGRGGMAEVYAAERADGQFEQQVALKRIKRDLGGDEAVQRFELERSILAKLQHPNIAQLIDGGVDPQGRPYLVMERVDGQAIDLYCDHHQLDLDQRLQLFLQVARAVEAAHRQLVIHRDIKPSNILVNHDGYAKLLDFGIAKLTDPDSEVGQLALTATDARVMTPGFASPEQLTGEAVTTASDVYQLGLLLYLLLTGCWPFKLGEGSPAELLRAICREPPMRPSAVLLESGIHGPPTGPAELDPAKLGAARSTTPERLRRQLSGDLDNILLTTLRKEPERRYRSVAQLIEDIERYFAGLPIGARPDTFFYRTGKLARRHLGMVTTAAAALVLLITLAVFYTVRLAEERDRAEDERDTARLEARKARQVTDTLRGLFEVSAPTRSKGEQVTARDLLDRGASDISERLGDQPRVLAEMLTLIGDIYRELALFDEAAPLLERGLELRREYATEAPLELAESLHARARLQEETDHIEAAQRGYEEALAIQRAVLGERHSEYGRTLGGLGRVLERLGEYADARQTLERAVGILDQAEVRDDAELGLSLLRLGQTYYRLSENDLALDTSRRALATLERRFEADHPHLADTRVLLGDVLRITADRKLALTHYEAALPVLEKSYGGDHPKVAYALNRLANLVSLEGDHQRAIKLHQRALRIRRQAFGPAHSLVASTLNNLGRTYQRIRSWDQARSYFEQSAMVAAEALGDDHPDVARALHGLAAIETETDQPRRAAAHLERVIAIREQAYGPDSPAVAGPARDLGGLLIDLGEPRRAEELLRLALAASRPGERYYLPEVLWPKIDLGRSLAAQQRFDEAEALLLEALADERIDNNLRSRALRGLIELYQAAGRPAEAAERERQSAALDDQ